MHKIKRTMTIKGNGHKIFIDKKRGITIGQGTTLTIENAIIIVFKMDAIAWEDPSSTLSLCNSTLQILANTGFKFNPGTLDINGTVNLESLGGPFKIGSPWALINQKAQLQLKPHAELRLEYGEIIIENTALERCAEIVMYYLEDVFLPVYIILLNL